MVEEITLMKKTGFSLSEIRSWDHETLIAVAGMYKGFGVAEKEIRDQEAKLAKKNAKKK